jgi:CRISPR/Cas system-associated endoribonuclease Cas2
MAKPEQKAFRYIVVYDISGPNEAKAMRRRKRFHYRFKQFMTPIQRSVMEGALTPTDVKAAIGLAAALIEPSMDTVKFYRQQATSKKEAPVAVLGTAKKLKLSGLSKKKKKVAKAPPKKNASLTRRQRAHIRNKTRHMRRRNGRR